MHDYCLGEWGDPRPFIDLEGFRAGRTGERVRVVVKVAERLRGRVEKGKKWGEGAGWGTAWGSQPGWLWRNKE